MKTRKEIEAEILEVEKEIKKFQTQNFKYEHLRHEAIENTSAYLEGLQFCIECKDAI